MQEFINWLNDLGRDDANTVFFRETAAQHWNHTDIGYFDDAQRLESNGTCIPISDSTPGMLNSYTSHHAGVILTCS